MTIKIQGMSNKIKISALYYLQIYKIKINRLVKNKNIVYNNNKSIIRDNSKESFAKRNRGW